VTSKKLEEGLEEILESPSDEGRVALIVARPAQNSREALAEANLDCVVGLVGDTWAERGGARGRQGSPHPDRQLTVMNARAAQLVAGQAERRQLAGDQLYVDLDLSQKNLPPGTRLSVGSAVIEVTKEPHLGCKKFAERFGQEAVRFFNSKLGQEARLRGLNARVITQGRVCVGDTIRKMP